MKILQLKSEQVKRLRVVEITPEGNVVVIGGRNGQGKTSVLDSIEWAFGGKPDAKMPVRKGEEKAKIVADLGELVVTRTITPGGGGSLVVKNADGVKQDSPQAILDKLVGKLTFDPLAFSRQKPPQQAEILRGLVGLDFAAHDKTRETAYDTRTTVNRDVASLKSRVESMPKYPDAPEQEQSAAQVMAAQAEAVGTNASNAAIRKSAGQAKSELQQAENLLEDLRRQAAALAERISRGEKVVENAKSMAAALAEQAGQLRDVDVTGFQTKLTEVEEANRKLRANRSRAEVVEQYKAKSGQAEKLTEQIEKLDAEKRQKINEAKYPIEGLAFDTAGGVTFNGIPFEQCSSAEQLKISVAIGLALNPKLRVLLVRDGSLLDDQSMALLAEMAAKADAQVWVERVGKDDRTSVIIEDGSVKVEEPAKVEVA